MSRIDQIKAEIERLRDEMKMKGEQSSHDAEIIRRAVISNCTDLLSFIAALDEQPSEDLEKLAEEYANSIAQFDMQRIYSKDDFKAGWKACKEQTMKDTPKWRKGPAEAPYRYYVPISDQPLDIRPQTQDYFIVKKKGGVAVAVRAGDGEYYLPIEELEKIPKED